MKSRNEKSGLQPDQLTGRKSDSRFESLSEALLESDVTDPVLPETVVFEPIMSSEGGSMEEVSGLLMVQGDSQQSARVYVASVSKVVPVSSSLHKAKHTVIQIVGSGESVVLREENGRAIPSSIHSSSSKDKSRGVQVLRGTQKLGPTTKKRDDRGTSRLTLSNRISSLVSDLHQVVVPEAHSFPAEVQQVQAVTGVQWNENLAFDQIARVDMQD
ncbi:hypothetical protein V6N12_051080 [Hibiscus sabdariffa]|uniref:Uncharacterized protein n=1 Tax=Hibiscus sabdariffa TaxID=183260 RepID=A0ABR2GED8_9ROSI